jgi:putative peptide zinc metalloprotease protein
MAALVAVATRLDQFVAETTDMNRWFHFESMALLACVIGGTKILHELGHAYTCKYFGGECHTIGPMLLLFSPALYCDTSDSWLLPSRWQRAAVGAAGIGVELVLASLATFVWITTPDGLIHYAAMNVMLVCSVSTLLFNANPLLRYDGYYVLSDLCDVPNLAQRSQRMLSSALMRWCFTGGESQETMQNPARGAMIGYAALAWIYRWSLTFTILFLLSRLLEPIGLRSVGLLLCFIVASTALYGILKPMTRFLLHPMKRRRVEGRRLMLTGIAAMMLVAIFSYPFPARVSAVATLTPQSSQTVYASVAGFVEHIVKPGQRVETGDLIVRLRNPAIELDYVTAQGKLNNQQALVTALQHAELHDATISQRLPAAIATLDDLSTQFIMHRGRKEALEVRATRSGVVLPGEKKSASKDDEEQLSDWIDYPTDEKNHGCFVANGTELFRIADDQAFEAELVLPQAVAQRVETDAKVKLSLASMPGDYCEGKVIDVSRRNMSLLNGDVDTTEAKSALATGTTALDVSYLVKVQLPQAQASMLPGQQGDALISTVPMSIARRIYLTLTGLVRMR